MKISWEKFLAEVSLLKIDGLPNSLRANSVIISVFWFLIFFGSSAYTVILIVRSINHYFDYKVTSTIRYITEQEAALPTLTLCDVDPFTSDSAKTLLDQTHLSEEEKANMTYFEMFLHIDANKTSERGYPLTLEEKMDLMEDALSVYYYEDLQMENYPKNRIHPTKIFHPEYLNCYVYNKEAKNITRSSNGMLMYILASDSTRNQLLLIQDSKDYLLGTDRSPYYMTMSMRHDLIVYRYVNHQYEWPYSDCTVLEDNTLTKDIPDRFVFDEVIATNATYTQKTCMSFCVQLMTVDRCACKSNKIGYNVTGVGYCSLADENECAALVWNSIDEINEQCLPKCPLECSQKLFKITPIISEQNIPGSEDIDGVQFNLRYNDLAYEETHEEPVINGLLLLGEIGGHLHLFLGMSLLSFVEIIEMAILMSTQLLVRSETTSKTSSSTQFNVENAYHLKMDAIPNAARASHCCLALVWLVLFVSSASACVYLIVDTIHEYQLYHVTTTLKYVDDMTLAVRFCNAYPMDEAYMINLTKIYNSDSVDQNQEWSEETFVNLHNGAKKTHESYLTVEEMTRLSDPDRMLVNCSINDSPCELELYYHYTQFCYQVMSKDRSIGNLLNKNDLFPSINYMPFINFCFFFI